VFGEVVRILIADDHKLFRDLSRDLLPRLNQNRAVVGEAMTGEATRSLLIQY
jgi:DNA-binding NarL/FixJ family response regulator